LIVKNKKYCNYYILFQLICILKISNKKKVLAARHNQIDGQVRLRFTERTHLSFKWLFVNALCRDFFKLSDILRFIYI